MKLAAENPIEEYAEEYVDPRWVNLHANFLRPCNLSFKKNVQIMWRRWHDQLSRKKRMVRG